MADILAYYCHGEGLEGGEVGGGACAEDEFAGECVGYGYAIGVGEGVDCVDDTRRQDYVDVHFFHFFEVSNFFAKIRLRMCQI